ALKEVRELVSDMRTKKLSKEIIRVEQILNAAEMDLTIHGDPNFNPISPLAENVLCMCMKESVTNIVKHSYGNTSDIYFQQKSDAFIITVKDDGIGIQQNKAGLHRSGIDCIKERLELYISDLHIYTHTVSNMYISVDMLYN